MASSVQCRRCGVHFEAGASGEKCPECGAALEERAPASPGEQAKGADDSMLTSNSSIFSASPPRAAGGAGPGPTAAVPDSDLLPTGGFSEWGAGGPIDDELSAADTTIRKAAVLPARPASGEAPAAVAALSPSGRVRMVPLLWFVAAASYASAVTLVLLYLYFGGWIGRTLDLPDLAPQLDAAGRPVHSLIKVGATLPPLHRMRIGQTLRFGNVRVTAVGVTKGQLYFRHYKDSRLRRPMSANVLRLDLKFENVSRSQSFSPLDRQLAFERFDGEYGEPPRSNNFVARREDRRHGGPVVLMYDLPTGSEWDIANQGLDRVLEPGQSWNTFLATTEEGIDGLEGPLVWRFQFRKGHNPKSGRGVLTVVDVYFDSSEISETPIPGRVPGQGRPGGGPMGPRPNPPGERA